MAGSGDTWSIGGKQPQTLISPIIGPGDGLSGSHNKYESDASPGRGGKQEASNLFFVPYLLNNLIDYYLNNGDVSVSDYLVSLYKPNHLILIHLHYRVSKWKNSKHFTILPKMTQSRTTT